MLSLFKKTRFDIVFQVYDHTQTDRDLFIVGNHDALGRWNPGKVAMDYMGKGVWEKSLRFERGTRLEYKFTRGNWDSEAANKQGKNLPNFHLRVDQSETRSIDIPNWKDLTVGEDEKQLPDHHITGEVRLHKHITPSGLESRDVIVWLPPGYEENTDHQYPVLYLHDGQNVFDPYTAYTGVEWGADETATQLIKMGLMEEIIMVGIYNVPARLEEYSLCQTGERYRRFVVTELKPFIDRNYRTLPDPQSTATIGSSMGGLVSFLLAWEYPHIFGRAVCMSPSFIFNNYNVLKMVRQGPAITAPLQLYIDCGNYGGEKLLMRGCRRMLRVLRRKGMRSGENMMFYHDKDGHHSEIDWAERLWRPMLFLFGNSESRAAVLEQRTILNPTKNQLQKS